MLFPYIHAYKECVSNIIAMEVPEWMQCILSCFDRREPTITKQLAVTFQQEGGHNYIQSINYIIIAHLNDHFFILNTVLL